MPEDVISEAAAPAITEAQRANDNNTVPASGSDSASAAGSTPEQKPEIEPEPEPEPEPALPPLTPQEFRIYNRLAEQMDYFVITPSPPYPLVPPPNRHKHTK